jgi:endonuclease/exonuclease/phosphatase family metal-dependent hydrolase
MTRSIRPLVVAGIALVSVLAACGADDESAEPSTAATTEPAPSATSTTSPPTTTPPPASLDVVTFNAGLARGFVDLAEERAPLVADAVAALDADVVAVQEVWEPRDVEALIAAAKDDFPEQWFLDPAPETAAGAACPEGELDALETCTRTACAGVAQDQLANCVLTSCGAEFGALSPTCQTCCAANIGASLDEIITTCEAAAQRYAYGGSFGIGLLSKHPIVSREAIVFESSLNRRAVLHAVLDIEKIGPVHVFATHLSPVFADVPYPGEGSWAAEQRAQIERLVALIAEKVPTGEPVVVLGDLNTGPAGPGFAAEVPENFALLPAAGLAVPYVDAAPDPACTFCAENPLVGGADDDVSVLIDHVLTRSLEATEVARVLDQPVTVGTGESRLSDHYGVAVTLAR